MKTVECVKKFFSQNGLTWFYQICTSKDKKFREATEEDFEILKNNKFEIDFNQDGKVILEVEIDLITFKINGISLKHDFNCYAGEDDKNIKLCEERDLSKEWIMFQLKSKGLIYATMFRDRMEKEKEKVRAHSESRRHQLTRKIEYLNRSIERETEYEKQEIKALEDIEKLAEEIN